MTVLHVCIQYCTVSVHHTVLYSVHYYISLSLPVAIYLSAWHGFKILLTLIRKWMEKELMAELDPDPN